MSSTLQPETERCVNRTGGTLAANLLVAVQGFATQFRTQQIVGAIANGTGRLVDGILQRQMTNNQTGYFLRDFIQEGDATTPIDTSLASIGDEVYLSPTVAGMWTLTKPSAAGQAVQRIGTVLVVNAITGMIRFNFQAGGTGGLQPNEISSSVLQDKPLYDQAVNGSGWFRLTGNVVEGELVTLGTRVYGFSAVPALPPGADVLVDVSAGLTPAIALPALVVAVNADALAEADVAVGGGDMVTVLGNVTGTVGNIALLTNSVNGIVSGANAVGGRAANRQIATRGGYIVTAADVTQLVATLGTSEITIGVFTSATLPRIASIQAYRVTGVSPTLSYAPIALAGSVFRMRLANATQWSLMYVEPGGGALLQADDLVVWDLSLDPGTP